VTHPFQKPQFRPICAHSASIVRAGEKSSIITNRKSTAHFLTSHRWTVYITPKSPKGWHKTRFCCFCHRVSLCENFQRQSCSCFEVPVINVQWLYVSVCVCLCVCVLRCQWSMCSGCVSVCLCRGAGDQRAWCTTSRTVHARSRPCAVCQRRCWISFATQSVLSVDVLWWKAVPVQAAQVDYRGCFTSPALWRQCALLFHCVWVVPAL